MSGLRGRAAPPWLLLRCACLALAPHRILPGFPLAGGSRQCWVCAADGSCACCQCPYRRLWQMRRGCCLVRFYSYAVPRTRAQCSSRCIPSQACLNPLLELVRSSQLKSEKGGRPTGQPLHEARAPRTCHHQKRTVHPPPAGTTPPPPHAVAEHRLSLQAPAPPPSASTEPRPPLRTQTRRSAELPPRAQAPPPMPPQPEPA